MPEPLEYRNPFRKDSAAARPAEEAALPAIPLEFERCIANTADHAAARAIEDALVRKKVEFFRGEDQQRNERLVTLFVRPADHEVAMNIAGTIFARRAKFRAHPKTRPMQVPYTGGLGTKLNPCRVTDSVPMDRRYTGSGFRSANPA